MTPIAPQMIEISPINNLSDIPTEIWIVMGIQMLLIVLVFWLVWKLISKFSEFITKLIRARKTDSENSSDASSLDDDWSDIEAVIKKENGNV